MPMFAKKMAGMFPDVGALKSELNDRFEDLLGELRQIRAVLEQIRDRPPAPPA